MNIRNIINVLKYLWDSGYKKEAWFVYVDSLQRYKKKDWLFDDWQHYDIIRSFNHGGGAFRRARGGSKTRDLSAVAVFLSLVNGNTIWFAAVRKQLLKAMEYWVYNPFIEKFRPHITRQQIYNILGEPIDVAVLNQGNARGPRGNNILFDEMSMMNREDVEATIGITNGVVGEIYFYYGSTPVINTIFQDACDTSEWHRVHPFYHCTWHNIEKTIKDKNLMAPAKWRQENLAHFTVMGGMVFEGRIIRGEYAGELSPFSYYGSDPNPREGYVVVGGQFSPTFEIFQVTFARDFGIGAAGKSDMLDWISARSRDLDCGGIEVEANGVGRVVCDDLIAMGAIIDDLTWNEDNKIERVNSLYKCTSYIPHGRMFDKTWNQVASLEWDETGKKVKKTKGVPYHFADSFLHAGQRNDNTWRRY